MSRELDARVAVEVMGLEVFYRADGSAFLIDDRWMKAPTPYSSEIADAWLVVEKMIENGWSPALIETYSHEHEARVWQCEFDSCSDDGYREDAPFIAVALTAPEAICLAALACMEVPDGK